MTPQKLEGYLTSRTAPDPAAAIWYPTTGCGGMSGSLTHSIQSQSGCVGGQYTLMGTRMVTTPYAFQNRMLGKWPTGDAADATPAVTSAQPTATRAAAVAASQRLALLLRFSNS